MSDNAEIFDACYYAKSCGRPYLRDSEWLAFFGGIADRIVADIAPRRVLDAGCAIGLLVETMRDRQIEAFGVDISKFAIAQVPEPFKAFCRQGSIVEPFGERYDLIVCIEVLEHMTAADGLASIANFCAHTDDILFSSSPTDFHEATHANVQPAEYWAAEFGRHGFYRDVDFDASFVLPWAVRYRRRSDPIQRIVADYERVFSRVVIERNEVRAAVIQKQAEIARLTLSESEAHAAAARANQSVAALTESLAGVRSEMERGNAAAAVERERAAAERERVTIEREQATVDLERARERATVEHQRAAQALANSQQLSHTIEMMKKSWFWRARTPWAWLSRFFRSK